MTVQDATGCEASDTIVVETLTVDINQNDTTICEGDSLELVVYTGNLSMNFGDNCSGIGNSGYVDLGDNLDMSGSFSVGGWVYSNGCNYSTIFQRENLDMSTNQPWGYYYGWDISHDGNQLEFNLVEQLAGHPVPSGFEVTVSTSPIYNQWYHLVGVFESGSSMKLYINGQLVNQVSTNELGYTNHDVSLLIGAQESDGIKTWFWDGKLDDMFIYDKALTSTEITSIFNGSAPQNNLKGFWNFNEGSGNTTFDISGNGYNGTITNAFYDNNAPQNNNSVLWSTSETTSSIIAKPSTTATLYS